MENNKEPCSRIALDEEYIDCPQCHCKVPDGNFCIKCGTKLHRYCKCSILYKPYDCGHSKCPGYALFVELAKKSLKLQEPYRGRARQIKDALARKHYHSDDERLKDAQAYIWISIGVIVISLIILLVQIMK